MLRVQVVCRIGDLCVCVDGCVCNFSLKLPVI